jgi:hypothetical protein
MTDITKEVSDVSTVVSGSAPTEKAICSGCGHKCNIQKRIRNELFGYCPVCDWFQLLYTEDEAKSYAKQ